MIVQCFSVPMFPQIFMQHVHKSRYIHQKKLIFNGPRVGCILVRGRIFFIFEPNTAGTNSIVTITLDKNAVGLHDNYRSFVVAA